MPSSIVARDGHWRARYLWRWRRPKTVATSWRSQFMGSHRVDGMLHVCGLRADGPTHAHDAEYRPVEAAFYPATSRRLRFAQAAPGANHFLGVASDGALYAWGSPRGNRSRGVCESRIYRVWMGILPRIGDQISVLTEVPSCRCGLQCIPLNRAGEIKQIHIGTCCEQSCALVTQSGDLYYFGIRTRFTDDCPIPSLMSIIDPAQRRVSVAGVALGDEHGLLVDVAGSVFSLGDGTYGQHDLGHVRLDSLVDGGLVVVSVAAGMNHSLFLSSAGEVYAFGDNDQGQLSCNALRHLEPNGVMIPSADAVLPAVVPTVALSRIASVSAGFNLSAFVTAGGAVFTCGQENEGGFGYATKFNFPQRVRKLAPHHVTCVSVGGGHMVALTADGMVFSWGNNDHSQCGRNESEEDLRLSGEGRGYRDNGDHDGISVYDVARAALPTRARFVSAGDTATFFILGEPLRVQ
jgi:alpha-tubulin suppressor-like RCC1 family protein